LRLINIYVKPIEELRDKDELIYDLIFSDTTEYEIHVEEYIVDIYKYDRFIDGVKEILRKSKVDIVREKITVEANAVIWRITVSK
jgi:hypothetical protein